MVALEALVFVTAREKFEASIANSCIVQCNPDCAGCERGYRPIFTILMPGSACSDFGGLGKKLEFQSAISGPISWLTMSSMF